VHGTNCSSLTLFHENRLNAGAFSGYRTLVGTWTFTCLGKNRRGTGNRLAGCNDVEIGRGTVSQGKVDENKVERLGGDLWVQ